MSQSASALTPANESLCDGTKAFCERHQISLREFSILCKGHRNKLSKSSTARFMEGLISNKQADRLRPIVSAALVRYLEENMFSPFEIENELSSFINPQEYMTMVNERCLLQPEVIRFFNLKHDPFDVDLVPELENIFSNPELDSIVDRLKNAIQYQRFVAVIGRVGSGKTLLKMRVEAELAQHDPGKFILIYPEFYEYAELTPANIANTILDCLDQTVPTDKAKRVRRVKEVLTNLQQDGVSVAIVIDEAHRLHDKVISSFKNFWEMTNGRSSRLLGVILFAQPSLTASRLIGSKFSEIRQRVQIIEMPTFSTFNKDTSTWNIEASQRYIAHRLELAGGNIETQFDQSVIERICLNAMSPLTLGNLVNSAFTAAFNAEEQRVTPDLPFFKTLKSGQQVLATRPTT